MVRRGRRHSNGTTAIIGGAIGAGLEINIVQGYEFLAKEYEDGDEVYILGFSRGAYTARSLVGMIRNCGLIYPKHLALRVPMAYGIYRTRNDDADSLTAKMFRSAFCAGDQDQVSRRLGYRRRAWHPGQCSRRLQHEILRIP